MRVLVVGLAVSGRAAVELLVAQGHDVVAFDADEGASIDRAEVHTGTWDPRVLRDVEVVVSSPGVPETSQVMRDVLASGVPVWSELELGFRQHPATPMVAITGTNGKTTVTELATDMLVRSGLDVAAVGNIGDPISAAPPRELFVVEASSFQLRFVDTFDPIATAIVNFAPDHLDWHPDVAAYGAAKQRIFERARSKTPVVFDADDPGAAGLVARAPGRLVEVSGNRRRGASGRSGDTLVLGDAEVALDDLARTDPAMLTDISVAAELAMAAGATSQAVVAAAVSYAPGQHRRQVVAQAGGVTFVDDSKATNPHAALAAIDAFPSVVLIAGGRAKGLDLRPVAEAQRVRHLVAIGESSEALLEARPDAIVADSMDDAVERAMAVSAPGDVVLLAPGCASFDMFDSYGARGDAFARAVLARVGH